MTRNDPGSKVRKIVARKSGYRGVAVEMCAPSDEIPGGDIEPVLSRIPGQESRPFSETLSTLDSQPLYLRSDQASLVLPNHRHRLGRLYRARPQANEVYARSDLPAGSVLSVPGHRPDPGRIVVGYQ